MCGIALIVSGIRIDLSALLLNFISPASQVEQEVVFSVDDIKTALLRRGPDSLGSKTVFVHPKISYSIEGKDVSVIEREEATKRDLGRNSEIFDCTLSTSEEHCRLDNGIGTKPFGELHFLGATLQLRGVNPIVQPLVDTSGNILIYNGEIFGGIHVSSDCNDADILMQYLGNCCHCSSTEHIRACSSPGKGQSSVHELLSRIKGPWALIYWQNSSNTLWWGRDAFGRRSLLVHWPTSEDPRLLLSSVSPFSPIHESSGLGNENEMGKLNFWEELPCGVYSISMRASSMERYMVGEVKKHEWTNPMLRELIKWERTSVEPKPEMSYDSNKKVPSGQQDIHSAHSFERQSESGFMQTTILTPSQAVLIALRESVMLRTSLNTIYQAVVFDCGQKAYSPVAVLFSGGLDSMILAALLDECLDPKYEIDLLNVSFDGQSAPDRISARAGVKELKKVAPLRRWKLVEIDADLLKLTSETKHVMSLINPAKTYMDLNIGIALWLAAQGDGWVYEGMNNSISADYQRVKYKSEARILLVGSGADEQCAGYGRHRTKYRHGSWLGLHDEMKLDMQRIWKRNLGRDDRCIADNGKEARFPFLDEDVIRILLDIPLWELADLDQPTGVGDKKILREVAQLLGLYEAAVLPKRAIQFGSRIARESNRKNFGSNRAANQASAGSVVIYGSSNNISR
ncbi:unnamed protein product [Ilex paraguariensis]|uniref:Asparagine synthetase domain-containing protein 1 n=1 Tax=Ilex paraguariensis TaxID=185542 RepID=A0ABC8RBT8_9AQUA